MRKIVTIVAAGLAAGLISGTALADCKQEISQVEGQLRSDAINSAIKADLAAKLRLAKSHAVKGQDQQCQAVVNDVREQIADATQKKGGMPKSE